MICIHACERARRLDKMGSRLIGDEVGRKCSYTVFSLLLNSKNIQEQSRDPPDHSCLVRELEDIHACSALQSPLLLVSPSTHVGCSLRQLLLHLSCHSLRDAFLCGADGNPVHLQVVNIASYDSRKRKLDIPISRNWAPVATSSQSCLPRIGTPRSRQCSWGSGPRRPGSSTRILPPSDE